MISRRGGRRRQLLRLGVEGWLIRVERDELADRATTLLPGLAEDVAQTGAVSVVAQRDVDGGVTAEFLAHDLGEHPPLQIVGGDRLPSSVGPSLFRSVKAGLVPPVNMRTLFGMTTAWAAALVTELNKSPMMTCT